MRSGAGGELFSCASHLWPTDEGKRAEYVAAYEVGLVSLKKALSDLLAPRDPALCDPSEWRGLVVLAVVVLPAHCGRHTWTSDKSRTAAKGSRTARSRDIQDCIVVRT